MFLGPPFVYPHSCPLNPWTPTAVLQLAAAHVEMAPPSVPPSWPTEAPDQLPLPSLEQSGMELQRNNGSFKYCQDTCHLEVTSFVGFDLNPLETNSKYIPEHWYSWKITDASFRMPYLFRCELLVSRRSVFFVVGCMVFLFCCKLDWIFQGSFLPWGLGVPTALKIRWMQKLAVWVGLTVDMEKKRDQVRDYIQLFSGGYQGKLSFPTPWFRMSNNILLKSWDITNLVEP